MLFSLLWLFCRDPTNYILHNLGGSRYVFLCKIWKVYGIVSNIKIWCFVLHSPFLSRESGDILRLVKNPSLKVMLFCMFLDTMWLYFYLRKIILEKYMCPFKVDFLCPISESLSPHLYPCNYYYYFICIATETIGQVSLEMQRCTCPKSLQAQYWWKHNERLHWADGSYETINNKGKHLCLFQSCTLHRGERSSHSLSKRA